MFRNLLKVRILIAKSQITKIINRFFYTINEYVYKINLMFSKCPIMFYLYFPNAGILP